MESLFMLSGGDDILYGGSGADALIGGFGNDELYGETGNDALLGDNGQITWRQDGSLYKIGSLAFFVGGKDLLSGGPGHDFMIGGFSDDVFAGSMTEDILIGDNGQIILNREGKVIGLARVSLGTLDLIASHLLGEETYSRDDSWEKYTTVSPHFLEPEHLLPGEQPPGVFDKILPGLGARVSHHGHGPVVAATDDGAKPPRQEQQVPASEEKGPDVLPTPPDAPNPSVDSTLAETHTTGEDKQLQLEASSKNASQLEALLAGFGGWGIAQAQNKGKRSSLRIDAEQQKRKQPWKWEDGQIRKEGDAGGAATNALSSPLPGYTFTHAGQEEETVS
jgi:Ca2+-binding RTX toxin-like protein